MSYLNIQKIKIRNFLSFGDYETSLDIEGLGSILILGEIENRSGRSNGAGKTSLLNAFLWCLFGKTFNNQNPGDRVVNWDTASSCMVQIATKDGWSITRTRKFSGKSELSVFKDGLDQTLSTTTNTQKFLEDQFNLDYDIFCASVFCGPKAFMEMSPQKRKDSLERILGLDKLNSFAQSAKNFCDKTEKEQEIIRARLTDLSKNITQYEENLAKNTQNRERYEAQQKSRIALIKKEIVEVDRTIHQIKLPDLDNLKKDWVTVNHINDKIEEIAKIAKSNEDKITKLQNDVLHYQATQDKHRKILSEPPDLILIENQTHQADKTEKFLNRIKEKILKTNFQSENLDNSIASNKQRLEQLGQLGSDCDKCGQKVSPDHIENHVKTIVEEIRSKSKILIDLKSQIDKLKEYQESYQIEYPKISIDEAKRILNSNEQILKEIDQLSDKICSAKSKITNLSQLNELLYSKIGSISKKLDKAQPYLTLDQANLLTSNYDNLKNKKTDLESRLAELSSDPNPYDGIIVDFVSLLDSANLEMVELNEKIDQLDIIFSSYRYIYRSYSDRRKIKKWLLSGLIPFLNDRIQYYLDAFGLNLSLSFSPTLSDEMDKWDYSFCSSGERKRIDVCITFALHDLLVSIYGQQCNLMILDEVDGHLDGQGVESFSELVVNGLDQHSKPKTIFVVSHKPELKDALPGYILIKKKNDFSFIETMQR